MGGESDSARRQQDGAPCFTAETRLMDLHDGPVAGIDEAGRGPWAGPVVAAAVILDPGRIPDGLKDSKLLAPEVRDELYDEIAAVARFGIGVAAVERVDRMNVLQASLWAMNAACAELETPPAAALVDGNRCPALPCPAEPLIGGDGLALSVAAASIVAKVARDRLMARLALEHPGYGWERNKGYGTREHAVALHRLGATPHHRRSFRPVRAAIAGAPAPGEAEAEPPG